jgi:hypothetical protein
MKESSCRVWELPYVRMQVAIVRVGEDEVLEGRVLAQRGSSFRYKLT